MKMYVNYYDAYQLAPGDALTIGIVLCFEKNEVMVRIILLDANERVMAAKYQTWLPSEEELSQVLAEKRWEAERALACEERGKAGPQQRIAMPEARPPESPRGRLGNLMVKRKR
jgi:hypothetical protein